MLKLPLSHLVGHGLRARLELGWALPGEGHFGGQGRILLAGLGLTIAPPGTVAISTLAFSFAPLVAATSFASIGR